ncbi:hypothetical protein [Pseudonocardia asaccharolytica]|uniref:Uncharacterized protein n=1 Tax=Pseudonocardia asaccharolytica DSM 44247 = NBRC 16224 TaxID=1123024 RepID=A0A511D089_9PSEU|nr:hypothetical protein [Pseudonocardia asaccharolytica]GEL18210.1 hypothetical protein PA7_20470 [Pseudonocardia asaccharolytica DSM 44247 = NBRC 16224]
MQLPISPEVLIPLAAGVAAVIIALVVLLARRRRNGRDVAAEPVAEPIHTDWTGEGANGPSEPVLRASATGQTQPVTVAEAVAERMASTAEPDPPPRQAAVPADHASSQAESNGNPERHGTGHGQPSDPASRPAAAGSSGTVADAVTQAFAARSAATRVTATSRDDAAASGEVRAVPPRGDIRDRLLEVLLDDPVRAIGAAVDLQRALGRLEKLTEAVRQEREALSSMLRRLVDAGLDVDQIGRLSGLSTDDVRAMLGTSAARRT